MNKYINLIILLVIVFFAGCTDSSSHIQKQFDFTGTWQVIESKLLNNDFLDEVENKDYYIGEKVILSNEDVCILNEGKKSIRYKLKSVDKNYILSEEFDLSMEDFLKDDERTDIISIIDDSQIIGEFFIDENNIMILFYKSTLFKLNKISDETEFTVNNEENEYTMHERENSLREGVMLGIKTPRVKLEDGTYSEERYRTIWIAHDDGDIGTIYEKENIIFPRINGIYKLKSVSNIIDNKVIDSFEVSTYDSDFKNSEINNDTKSNRYKSIKFVGNDYIAIEEYIGDSFRGEYPIYKIVPVANINSNEGVQINEIFNNDAKEKYNDDFYKVVNSLSEDELKVLNVSNIDYSNITMERNFGKWVLISKIKAKNDTFDGFDFKLSLLPNKKLINYNYLNISWKSLKSELGFFKDAYTSPNGEIVLIQYNEYIAIYRIDNGVLLSYPLAAIPIDKNDEIIMAEWSEGTYVEQWEKIFSDGEIILEDEETDY